jgi:hypothetical protein
MRKAFYVFAALVLVATVTLVGGTHVVKAQGTVPCGSSSSGGTGSLDTCSVTGDFGGLPAGAVATITDVPPEDIVTDSGLPPSGLHTVGGGVEVWVFDKYGNPVDWVNPAFKICFPVYDGQVRLWVPPEELSLPEWFGVHFTYGVWEPIATVYENGMTCGIHHEPEGLFAVFHTNATP